LRQPANVYCHPWILPPLLPLPQLKLKELEEDQDHSNVQPQNSLPTADQLEAGIAALTGILDVLRNCASQPAQPSALGKHARESEPEVPEAKEQELALIPHEHSNINVLRPPPAGKSSHLFETVPQNASAPQMWLSSVSDPATATFSHTVSVIQQCLKDNHEIIADITSLQSNLPKEMHTRLDGARLQNEQAAALMKMQARTFSYHFQHSSYRHLVQTDQQPPLKLGVKQNPFLAPFLVHTAPFSTQFVPWCETL